VDERPIRNAATAICVRDAEGVAEVLVVERSQASRFLPGYVAFPGGAVDTADEEHAVRWFGDSGERHRAAAVRELVEEVGLALTGAGLVPTRDLAAVEASPPSPAHLHEMAHWVAPPDVPVRFDARFFAVAGVDGVDPTPDGAEASAAWWVSPRALMAEWEAGARKLYWPTYVTVANLAICGTAAEMLSLRYETREPTDDEVASLPRSVMEQV
jgi:8-oxo-dGTP pyrophosphatase MutT (NUDIX family)